MEREYDKKVKGCVDNIMSVIEDSIRTLISLGVDCNDDEAYVTVSDKYISDFVENITSPIRNYGMVHSILFTPLIFTPLNRSTLNESVKHKLKEAIENHKGLYLSDVYYVGNVRYLEIGWRD